MRVLLLFALLIGIPAIGALNYLRNAPLDEELANRPYGGLSDADLDALLAAYEGQVKRTRETVEEEPSMHAFNDPGKFGDYDEKVEAFEKFQNSNETWKHERNRLYGEQDTLGALQHEKSIRARGLDEPTGRIWRRISTF
jgi:hypothetical protein